MRDRGSFSVSGTRKEDLAGSTSFPSTPIPLPRSRRDSPFVHPSNTFQNPMHRAKTVRKQIYVADMEESGKISAYTTVHVTISEGQGVQVVGETVKEYLNSADCFTICDSKGLAIVDTAETRNLEFWKIASRKLYAIRTQDLTKAKTTKFEKYTKKRIDPEDNKVLDSLLEVELEIKNSTGKLSEHLQEKSSELSVAVSQVHTQVAHVAQQCLVLDEVKAKITELVLAQNLSASLRQTLACKMCTNIPVTLVVVTACCGQVAGCGPCVQTYLKDNDSCLFCKATAFSTKLIFLRGLSEVLDQLK